MIILHRRPVDLHIEPMMQLNAACRAAGPMRAKIHAPKLFCDAFAASIARKQGKLAGEFLSEIQDGRQLLYAGIPLVETRVDCIEVHGR